MNRAPPCIAAFTLIEMMIAVALGSMIIMVAVSGFRTAAQTMTVASRLSLENSMMRAGYFEAQIQLDFWTNLDDPTKPDNERPLKSESLSIGQITDWTGRGRERGLPFTPMSALSSRGIWPKGGGNPRAPTPSTLPDGAKGNFILPRAATQFSDPAWELDRGWDPTFYWSPHDPRTWCRANMAEKERGSDGRGNDGADNLPPIINGRYAIFGNTSPTSYSLATYTIKPDLNNPDEAQRYKTVQVSYSGYPSTGIHSWYYNQLNGLIDAMGYAAFCDYLPSNSIYTWYRSPPDPTKTRDAGPNEDWTVGDIYKYGISPNYNFTNWDGNQRNSRGIYRNTYSTTYGYLNPRTWDSYRVLPMPTSGPITSGNTLRQRFYQHFDSDYNATERDPARLADADPNNDWHGIDDLQWFLARVNFPEPLLASKPSNWPDVHVSVGRLIKNAHFVAVAKVRRFSPHTGELIELSWTGLGTTLRGARQQRHQTTGWAFWDNGPGATPDPHLDTP
jgi:hypothetical protein